MADTAQWLSHTFTVYRSEERWNNVAGIYIFAGVDEQDQWDPLYVGQADSFQNRIPSHEKWDEAQSLGATHVHAMVVQQEETRQDIERQLIQAYQPPLNIQLR